MLNITKLKQVCSKLKSCCDIQIMARPQMDKNSWCKLYEAMTVSESARVKRHLDSAGGPLLLMIKETGTVEQRIALLIAYYMFEIRKVDWTALCIHAEVWDEIKRDMQFHASVYYLQKDFDASSLVHNLNGLYELLEASKKDSKTFRKQFLMFKLTLL